MAVGRLASGDGLLDGEADGEGMVVGEGDGEPAGFSGPRGPQAERAATID